jgi:DNA modification methylase
MTINSLQGDCRKVLQSLPDKTFHTCVTSPPYWGLRDYGEDDQLGLEETPQEYVANLVKVFREVRRVLRDDGTVWLNLGDSYSSGGRKTTTNQTVRGDTAYGVTRPPVYKGLKPKDLVGIPWRVAFALQEDGWYLRQDIIWNKRSCMPESVKDRCTKSHEYIFLLSKSKNYYFDNESIKEKGTQNKSGNVKPQKGVDQRFSETKQGLFKAQQKIYEYKNKRSVWTIAPTSYKEAHFATYPPDLIEPCILAGCPEGGYVLDPFGGAGTTGLVADRLGRNTTLIELNPTYAALADHRIKDDCPLFTTVENNQITKRSK